MPFDIPDNDVAFNANQSIWMSTDIDILAAGLNGVGVVSGCAVTAQGSPDMTVAIASGVIRIANGSSVNVTSGNGTITTADGTNPRIDLVSVSNSGTKTVTAGTAAANPKPPDLPSGHVALAMVYVPASDTTIASNQITDKRVILPVVGTTFVDTFTGNGSQTTFTLSQDPDFAIVVVSGSTLGPADFTITGTSLVFTSAPANAAAIVVTGWVGPGGGTATVDPTDENLIVAMEVFA